MTSAYGVGVTNRYELFCNDDESNETLDTILIKSKQQKKAVKQQQANTAEKENKHATQTSTGQLIKGLHQQDNSGKIGGGKGMVSSTNQATNNGSTTTGKAPHRAIKETQNIRTNLDRPMREGRKKTFFLFFL